jgi:hypothetical protein
LNIIYTLCIGGFLVGKKGRETQSLILLIWSIFLKSWSSESHGPTTIHLPWWIFYVRFTFTNFTSLETSKDLL